MIAKKFATKLHKKLKSFNCNIFISFIKNYPIGNCLKQMKNLIKKARIFREEIPFVELMSIEKNGVLPDISLNYEKVIIEADNAENYREYWGFITKEPFLEIQRRAVSALKYGDSDTKRLTYFSFDRERKVLRLGFHPTKYSIYKGFREVTGQSHWGEGLDIGWVGSRLLSNHCGTGIFIDCADDDYGRVLIEMTPNHDVIDTHRLCRTYSASGSLDWEDKSVFDGVLRETKEEINYNPSVEKVELISFGYDTQLNYFQFSFYYKANESWREISEEAKRARDANEYLKIDRIPYNINYLREAADSIVSVPWEPSALYSLMILFARLIRKEIHNVSEAEYKILEFRQNIEKRIEKI
jgi:hypothetical protein